MLSLDDTFLQHLIHHFDGDDVVALGLTGSHARGTATRYSDIDIYRFTHQPPKDAENHYRLEMIEGHLISITGTTIAAKRDDLTEPQTAIWAVPGLRQMQVLLDKSGELAVLKREAEAFQWSPLQPAADRYASTELMGYAEEARKVLSAFAKGNDSALLYGTYGLALGLPRIILVQKGILLESENAFFKQAQNVFGIESDWSQHFLIAAGFATLPAEAHPARMRGYAALQLYLETVYLLHAIIRPEHVEVIETTVSMIQSAMSEWLSTKEHS